MRKNTLLALHNTFQVLSEFLSNRHDHKYYFFKSLFHRINLFPNLEEWNGRQLLDFKSVPNYVCRVKSFKNGSERWSDRRRMRKQQHTKSSVWFRLRKGALRGSLLIVIASIQSKMNEKFYRHEKSNWNFRVRLWELKWGGAPNLLRNDDAMIFCPVFYSDGN